MQSETDQVIDSSVPSFVADWFVSQFRIGMGLVGMGLVAYIHLGMGLVGRARPTAQMLQLRRAWDFIDDSDDCEHQSCGFQKLMAPR